MDRPSVAGDSTLGSGVTASDALARQFPSLRSSKSVIKICIVNNEFVNASTEACTGHEALGKLVEKNVHCYFFVKQASDKWLFISWVPEGTLSVKDRMVAASSSDSVKRSFGSNLICDELHATTLDELSVSHYKQLRGGNRADMFSEAEKAINEAHKAEAQARKEQSVSSRVNRFSAASDASVDETKSDTSVSKPTTGGGIGGYHTVQIPLTNNASEVLKGFATGDINWVQLAITDDNKTCDASDPYQVSGGNLISRLVKLEPRFYLYRTNSKIAFIYLCPQLCKPKQRMVYSTAKPAISASIAALGISIDKNVEYSDIEDVTQNNIANELRGNTNRFSTASNLSSTSSLENVRKSTASAAPHPVYSLMGNQSSSTGGRKKIVIPPPGAY